MVRSKNLLIVGCAMVAIAVLGFLTVADDLAHVGELVGVGSILLAGFLLVTAGLSNPVSRNVELQWLALAVLSGAILGAALDDMLLGVGIGAVLGLVLIIGISRVQSRRATKLTM